MNLAFDNPQWKIVPDIVGVRPYANVSNRLSVSYEAHSLEIPIAVPSELFTFMHEVLQVSQLDSVVLYLDFDDGFWLFGLMLASSDEMIDLWRYSEKNPPDCIIDLLKQNGIRL